MSNILAETWRWLRLEDYEAAKMKSTNDIIARYSRGNTMAQTGCIIDDVRLAIMSADGTKASENLRKIFKRDAA